MAVIDVSATPAGPALLLRRWETADAEELVGLYRDEALRRWTSATVEDVAGAAQWIRKQGEGWEAGDRFGLAVVEPLASGDAERLVGHVVLRRSEDGAPSGEVGYWTAAHARGKGVAPRAVLALTEWAFSTFEEMEKLALLHQVDNIASCRVAMKCRYELSGLLPPAPPDFPREAHLHVRTRGV
ncbi:GNAT family N-acetyltransferase [Actinomadura barringtoniae]|uniref:GNAT family N-acetyltransferase n=1 Tax=Actinomadura barringtoniae TaxID=1427535 RepID=A0A939PT94_9ACTN|nr:GNAT family N-acetyltransferase [Actinomadura barringtoniae]MBO2454366.1 GNAT family N-acetyltransferase [Actinomadura barringtoniae]